MGHRPTAIDPSIAPDISVSQSSPTFSIPSPRHFDRFHAPRPAVIRAGSEQSINGNGLQSIKGFSDDFLERYNPCVAGNLAAAAKQAETAANVGYLSSNGPSNGSRLFHSFSHNDLAMPDAGSAVGHHEMFPRHVQASPQPRENNEKNRYSRDLSRIVDVGSNLREHASMDSGYDTGQASVDSSSFTPLQDAGFRIQPEELNPINEDNQRSFDLVAALQSDGDNNNNSYSLERRSEQLFSRDHLQAIFDDPLLLSKFTSFISARRPQSMPHLLYYLETQKALRAIRYANALVDALRPKSSFIQNKPHDTINTSLENSMEEAFQMMVREDLPAYVTHTFIQVASSSIQKRITGTLAPHLQEVSEGLAEVFCLTDPSRPDNPIIFASEEFHWTTQYGVSHAIGRNCRFLQGPMTDVHSIRRLREAVAAGKEHSEAILNYRRDGSPFMNLLMIAPLVDSKGDTRYHIGAQVDVSGLVRDCTDLQGLQNMLLKLEGSEGAMEEDKDEFQEMCEMFNDGELYTARRYGGHMHKGQLESSTETTNSVHRPRLLLKEPSPELNTQKNATTLKSFGNLEGIYKHYLLIRPFPSLRILFTSPSLRVPGIQQSSFLDRIGGSSRVRDELEVALSDGRGVTAKVRWLTRGDSDTGGQPRWIHCTPLQGPNGKIGIWMIILVDEANTPARSFKKAPPVASNAIIRETSGVTNGSGLPATGQSSADASHTTSGTSTVRSSAIHSGPGTAITTNMARSDSLGHAGLSRSRAKTISSNADRSRIPSPSTNGNGHMIPKGVSSGSGRGSPQYHVPQRQDQGQQQQQQQQQHPHNHHQNRHAQVDSHAQPNQYKRFLQQYRPEPNGYQQPYAQPPYQHQHQHKHTEQHDSNHESSVDLVGHGTVLPVSASTEKQSRFAHYLNLELEMTEADISRPETAKANGISNGATGLNTPDNFTLGP